MHGCWLNMGHSLAAEIVGQGGFDWVLVDLEHGAGGEAMLLPQLQALHGAPVVPLARVESHDGPRVQRALDAGAFGVMFPRIKTLEEARAAMANMYYPPRGRRGLASMVRAMEFGKRFDEYLSIAEKDLLGIIQIETRGALDHLDAIAALQGVDVLFVGPADLSLALGIFGQWDHPLFIDAVRSIGDAAHRHGKVAGAFFLNPAQYDFYYQYGFRFLACGSDVTFLSAQAASVAAIMDRKRQEKDKL